ncbi:MAG: hypothetical protein AB7I29_08510 [Geobacter sp.]|jgi:hypothetical protein
MGIDSLRDMVSEVTIARLEKIMPPKDVDKLLLSIAQTMCKKLQSDKPETLPL